MGESSNLINGASDQIIRTFIQDVACLSRAYAYPHLSPSPRGHLVKEDGQCESMSPVDVQHSPLNCLIPFRHSPPLSFGRTEHAVKRH